MQDPKTRQMIRRACQAALALNAIGLTTALAQPAGEEPVKMDKIVVTGSLIPEVMEVNSPAPVDVISSAELEKMNVKALEDLTRRLPATIGAGNYGSSRGNGGDGSAGIALRGIPGGTLVLLNGRRVPNQDLNTIPMAALERVEVLLDGGSAIYGADAVAGVVNFITRKDFTGTELNAYYGNTTDTDVGRQNYSFVTGHSDADTSFMVSGSFYKQNDLMSQDRSRSEADITNPANTSSASNPGRLIAQGDLVYDGPPGTTGTSIGDYRPFTVTDRFPYPEYTPAIRPEERYNFFSSAEQKIFGDNLKFFAEGNYTHLKSYNQLAPTPIFSPFVGNGLIVPASNPYNVFGVDDDYFTYRTVEAGPRTETTEGDAFRVVTGLTGYIGDSDLQWQTAFNYGRDRRTWIGGGELSASALQEALNDTDPATAFNPYGNQANSAAQMERVTQDLMTIDDSQLVSFDASVYGDIIEVPAGMLGTAVGVMFTEERYSSMPDAAQRMGDTVGFNSAAPLSGTRRYDSAFTEFRLPVVSPDMDVTAVHMFETGVAVRYDNYSDFGSTWNPKVWMRWQPINETVTLRGSYGTSFLPPSFGDLYTTAQESYPELRNPARGAIEGVSDPTSAGYDPSSADYEAGWDSNLYPTFEQIKTIYSGNPDLEAETAENFTAGMVYTPDYLKNLTVSVDWFKIEQDNIAGSVDQFILDQNFNGADPSLTARNKPTDPNAPFASNVVYDPNTTTYFSLYAPTFNLSKRVVEGLDFKVRYDIPTDNIGLFTLGLDMTHYYRFEQQNLPGDAWENRLGQFVDPSQGFGLGSLPRWKGNVNAFWNFSDLELGAIVYWISSYSDDPNVAEREVDDWVSLDLQASYNLPRDVRLTVGVQNVTDEAPPLVVGAFADNYDRDTHSLLGRFVYGQVSVKF